jgi:nucleoside-triphosphatase
MKELRKNILITGSPGVGKTTLIRKVAEELKEFQPAGFFTAEIREHGIRKGFELISLSGNKGILSHINIKSPYRVGKYNVNLKGFETFLDSLPLRYDSVNLIVIDEIGKMECFSNYFSNIIRDILNSKRVFLATISLKGRGLIADIKKRDDIELFVLRKDNRNALMSDILAKIHALLNNLKH